MYQKLTDYTIKMKSIHWLFTDWTLNFCFHGAIMKEICLHTAYISHGVMGLTED